MQVNNLFIGREGEIKIMGLESNQNPNGSKGKPVPVPDRHWLKNDFEITSTPW
jgi:hypothetical protein